MIDEDLSGLPRSALRDYSDDPRLSRVWRRLEANLARRPARSRSSWVLAPALGVALFAAGVVVGRTVLPPQPAALPPLQAERLAAPEPAPNTARPAASPSVQPPPPVASTRPRPAPIAQRTPAPAPVVAEPREVVTERETVAPAPLTPPGPPEWLQLAEVGDFAAARAALDRGGGFNAALVQAAPEQLLVLVDVARASGGRDQAIRALRRLVDHFPDAPEAPLAAWTLGNMLEQAGDGAGAAQAFELYRRLSPTGDFADDAAARQVHVALAQGNVERAAELLDQYAKEFPNGRRLDELREELEKRRQEQADGGVLEGDEPDLELPEPPTPPSH